MLFFAIEVALDLDVDISRAKDVDQLLDGLPCSVIASACQCSGQRPFTATCQADQSFAVFLEITRERRAFGLRTLAQFEMGGEAAEILISGVWGAMEQ